MLLGPLLCTCDNCLNRVITDRYIYNSGKRFSVIDTAFLLATLGIQRPSSVVRTGLYHPEEPRHQFSVNLFNENQRRDFSNLSTGLDALKLVSEKGVLIRLMRGCIIIEMLLTDPEALEHYIDPFKRDVMVRKIKDFLVEERIRERLEADDIEDMIVDISEENIAEAKRFFELGQYSMYREIHPHDPVHIYVSKQRQK